MKWNETLEVHNAAERISHQMKEVEAHGCWGVFVVSMGSPASEYGPEMPPKFGAGLRLDGGGSYQRDDFTNAENAADWLTHIANIALKDMRLKNDCQ